MVSPPEHCAQNDPENVATVSLPGGHRSSSTGSATVGVRPLPEWCRFSLLFDWAAQHEAEEEPEFPVGDYCENFQGADPAGLAPGTQLKLPINPNPHGFIMDRSLGHPGV